MKRGLTVEYRHITVNQVPFDDNAGLRVVVSIDRAQPVLDLGRVCVAVLILDLRTAAVRANHF